MRSKLSWVPFIPLALLACFFKLAQGLLPEGAVLGLSDLHLDYAYMASVVLILLISFILSITDKKISPYYSLRRNVPATLTGLLLALAFAADGANSLFHLLGAGSIEVLNIFDAVFALLSAIVFVVLGLNHSFRNKESKRFKLLYVIPAVFCAIRMIVSFVTFTTISIRLADVGSLLCYILATMFFFYYAVMLSLTKTKNAAKNCIVFGLPAIAALLPYGVFRIWFRFDGEILLNNINAIEAILMGLYILSFLIELTRHVREQESVEIVVEDDEEPELEENVDDFLTGAYIEDEKDKEESTEYMETSDTDGYLYQDTHQQNDNNMDKQDIGGYLTDLTDPETTDQSESQARDYESRLDEIDKLILDISNMSD